MDSCHERVLILNSSFPWLKGVQCLVTGGAGFIGAHLCEALLKQQAHVTVLDNLYSGKMDSLRGLNVNFIHGSVTDFELLRKAIQGAEYVFHLAAIPAVPRSLSQPQETAWNNIWGTQCVLEASRLAGVKRVIYSASSSAYGDTPGEDARTENLSTRPLSPYAAQKLSGEYLCRAYALTLGLDTVSLRYFNVFGPRQNPDSAYAAVIPKFIRLAMENKIITVYGTGEQKRDFTYIENVVNGNLCATRTKIQTRGEVLNIACGNTFSLNDFLNKLEKILNMNLRIENQPPRAGDVTFSLADITKAKKLIGYAPTVEFDTGLERLVNFFKTENK